jgi:hypothetical protein
VCPMTLSISLTRADRTFIDRERTTAHLRRVSEFELVRASERW